MMPCRRSSSRDGFRHTTRQASRPFGFPHAGADNVERSRLIEFVIEVVLTVLWEAFIQIASELLFEVGLRSMGESFRRHTRAHPVLAGIGIALWGALAGVLASLVWPARIFQTVVMRGSSLLISPLVTGAVMEQYGRWRDRQGTPRSHLATFWGGALFAFSMALVRFMWVGR